MDEKATPFPFPESGLLEFSPQWAELRGKCPVARVELPHGAPAWLATGYDEVRQVLVDPRFSRARAAEHENRRLTPAAILNSSLIGLDPPDHTRLRSLAAHAFTARRVERLRPRVVETVTALLDSFERREKPADLMEHFLWPLPATLIGEMMGVRPEDNQRFIAWSSMALAGPERMETATEGYESLKEFFGGLIAEKRESPGDDLLSALIEATDEQGRLTDEELVALSVLLLVAGHESTTTVFGTFVVVLTEQRPDQWRHLLEHPEDITRTVEELLRTTHRTKVGGAFPRVTTEDVTLGGVRIAAGEAVIAAPDAANRDPAVFPDPERLDFARADNPHVAFGAGTHFCIGAPLARMEIQEGLRMLLERLPGLRVAVPVEELRLTPGTPMRVLEALPVTW